MEHKYRKKPVVIDAWQFTKDNYKKVCHTYSETRPSNTGRNMAVTLLAAK